MCCARRVDMLFCMSCRGLSSGNTAADALIASNERILSVQKERRMLEDIAVGSGRRRIKWYEANNGEGKNSLLCASASCSIRTICDCSPHIMSNATSEWHKLSISPMSVSIFTKDTRRAFSLTFFCTVYHLRSHT